MAEQVEATKTDEQDSTATNTDLISKLRDEAAKRRVENKELKEQLEKIQSERAAKEEEALKEQNKYKELYEKQLKELESMKQIQDQLKKYQERENARKEQLLKSLPDELAEKHKEDSISVVETIAELVNNSKKPNSIGSEDADSKQKVTTLEDIDKLAATNPAEAIKLLQSQA